MNLTFAILGIGMFAICVTLHEFGHAWVAYKCGDDTAKRQGRLSFNPIDHIDPIGTIILPLFLVMTNAAFVIGWAKPVPVDTSKLRDRRDDEYWISLAGPLANFIQAIVGAVVLGVLIRIGLIDRMGILYTICILYIRTNIGLGVFNLIPVPPLDGFSVLKNTLPHRLEPTLESLEPMGMFILLILMSTGALGNIIQPIASRSMGMALRLLQWVAAG